MLRKESGLKLVDEKYMFYEARRLCLSVEAFQLGIQRVVVGRSLASTAGPAAFRETPMRPVSMFMRLETNCLNQVTSRQSPRGG